MTTFKIVAKRFVNQSTALSCIHQVSSIFDITFYNSDGNPANSAIRYSYDSYYPDQASFSLDESLVSDAKNRCIAIKKYLNSYAKDVEIFEE